MYLQVLMRFLLFDDLTTIKIEHYKRAADIQETAKVKFPLSIDIHDKKILIVDDIIDKGKTLRLAVEYLNKLDQRRLKRQFSNIKYVQISCQIIMPKR